MIILPSKKLTPGKDANTKLLLHFDGANNGTTFIDECGKTITVNGNTCTKTATKKFGLSSGFFDGTGDYLSATHADLDISSGNSTIEFWMNPVAETYICGQATAGGDGKLFINYAGGELYFGGNGGGKANIHTTGAAIATGAWTHARLVNAAGTGYILINGVQKGTGAVSWNSSTTFNWGVVVGYYYSGYFDEFRLCNVSRGTAAFTSPLAAYY